MQIVIWTVGGASILVALLTGVQLLPETPQVSIDVPDPRNWIKLDHLLYRWMFLVLTVITASSLIFEAGAALTVRAAGVRKEAALIIASMTALVALLVARGLTEVAFEEGWGFAMPDFAAGWTNFRGLIGWFWNIGGAIVDDPRKYGFALFVGGLIVFALLAHKKLLTSISYVVLLVLLVGICLILLWPLLKIVSAMAFYFAFCCALFYAVHHSEKREGAAGWLILAVLLVWGGFALVEMTGAGLAESVAGQGMVER